MLTRADINHLKHSLAPRAPVDAPVPPDDDYYEPPTDIPDGADGEINSAAARVAETSSPTPGRGTPPLKLTYFDDCGKTALRRWILKGIIARSETSAWVAPPGAGKSGPAHGNSAPLRRYDRLARSPGERSRRRGGVCA